jgi:hypothetical protein
MIELTLRHLWTRTGGPLTWSFNGADDTEMRDLLERLETWSADPELRSAVLLAHDDDQVLIGAWNREGASQLRELIDALPRAEGWLDFRHALLDGVTGP